MSLFQLGVIINGGDGSFALGHEMIVQHVGGERKLVLETRHGPGHDLIENVVTSLQWLLGNDASLLQQIWGIQIKYVMIVMTTC